MATVLNFYHVGKVIPPGAEYIGRAMPHLGLKASKFANPYNTKTLGITNEEAAEKYRGELWRRILRGIITEDDLLALEGKDLVCFCKQKNKEVACHGDVVKSAVEWAVKRRDANEL